MLSTTSRFESLITRQLKTGKHTGVKAHRIKYEGGKIRLNASMKTGWFTYSHIKVYKYLYSH